VVQFCGRSYHLVHNRELVLPIYEKMKAIFGETGFKTEARSFDDKRFYVRFTLEDRLHTILGKDTVCPEVVIRNSYDGTVKQMVGIGYVRQICANGLMAFTSDVTVSIKHSKKFGAINLEPIFKKLEKLEIKLDQFKKLSDRIVTPEELKKIALEIRTKPTIKYPKKMIDVAVVTAQKESYKLRTPLSAWLVYNGFNNPLNHTETKLLPEEATMFKKTTLNSILPLVLFIFLCVLNSCSSGAGDSSTSNSIFSQTPEHQEVVIAFAENLAKGHCEGFPYGKESLSPNKR